MASFLFGDPVRANYPTVSNLPLARHLWYKARPLQDDLQWSHFTIYRHTPSVTVAWVSCAV